MNWRVVMQNHQQGNRLSWGDTVFLHLERDGMPLNVACVSVLEGEIRFEDGLQFIESKLPLIPRLFKRVVAPPLNLGLPSWENDPNFDIRNHVREVTLKHRTEGTGWKNRQHGSGPAASAVGHNVCPWYERRWSERQTYRVHSAPAPLYGRWHCRGGHHDQAPGREPGGATFTQEEDSLPRASARRHQFVDGWSGEFLRRFRQGDSLRLGGPAGYGRASARVSPRAHADGRVLPLDAGDHCVHRTDTVQR